MIKHLKYVLGLLLVGSVSVCYGHRDEDIIYFSSPEGEVKGFTYKELIDDTIKNAPALHEWCVRKQHLTSITLRDRETTDVSELLTYTEKHLGEKAPRYIVIDVLRVIRDATRKDSSDAYYVKPDGFDQFSHKVFDDCIFGGF